ncbi:DNA mismatch repair protein MLH1 [Quillaja saponaria]|uniref:DNA mismatch repair protein MLH1 n=1 Tax=Quillaja saponaria TaxID=32244 RepID=A0AAD7PRP8_QUISA|nr:DNA mismatch repair protein MLH1 [Quillaja saponaria]
MHQPMLPNPYGDGLQFYNERKPFKNSEDDVDHSGSTGTDATTENEVEHGLLSEAETAWAQRERSIQHVLFPPLRLFFKPPTGMATNGTFVQVASLENLYKIFERC